MTVMIASRFAGISQFEQCINDACITMDGFDADGDLVVEKEL